MLAGKAPRRLMACYGEKRQRSMPTLNAVKSEQLFLRRDTRRNCKIRLLISVFETASRAA